MLTILENPQIAGLLLHFLDAALLGLLGYVSLLVRRHTGIEARKKDIDLIHSALMTGATAALVRGATPEQAAVAAVNHTLGRGASDAVARAKVTIDDLAEIAPSKVGPAMQALGMEIGKKLSDQIRG